MRRAVRGMAVVATGAMLAGGIAFNHWGWAALGFWGICWVATWGPDERP